MKKRNFPDELMFLVNRKLPQHETNVSLKDKVCVISGATSGVGLEATKQLVQAKAHVVIIARNPDKAHQLKQDIYQQFGQWIDIIIADFSSLDDVRNAANTLLSNYPTIDILINSAGIHSTKRTYTSEGFETVFCVNHLAPFLLTKLLLNRMIASAPSRILHVNSEGHRFNGLNINDLHWKKRVYTGLRSYGASKTAQLLTMWEINDQLKGTGVTINAMHPGDVK
jgi:NAD(P)-dependent dehydrogenase (short-subunit alcohol dehydrogenase family)